MRHEIFGIGCSALLAVGIGLAAAQEAPQAPKVTGSEELVQKKGPFRETWVHPNADIARYSRIFLWAPAFEFREGGETSTGTASTRMRGNSGPYAIREEDRARFQKVVSDTFVDELARSKVFEVVDQVGPGTLILQVGFLDITSFVPPNPSSFGDIHLAAVGEATLVAQLIDAETGVIQAGALERRLIQPEARMRGVNTAPANSATVWADVERWAREQGEDLRKALEKAKKKADERAE